METLTSRLDDDELLRLALLDCQTSRQDAAIDKLKQLIERRPDMAVAHFLLAAEHAELGLFERAIAGTERALSFDPNMTSAHFQLGLLHYSQGDLNNARTAWSSLSANDDETMFTFKSALLALAGEDRETALDLLAKGLSLGSQNQALLGDMLRIKNRLEAERTSANQSTVDTASSNAHALLASYQPADGEGSKKPN